jgi:recA bacterial DNA recombination protein
MAVMGKFAWPDSNLGPAFSKPRATSPPTLHPSHKIAEILEFPEVFRGRELTCKERRIPCGLLPIDNLIQGGIVRGRISEIVAEPGAGKTSLAAAFAASVTRREAAAWIDASDNFDPASIGAAGVKLTRLLWVSSKRVIKGARAEMSVPPASRFPIASLKVAEWILAVGGFGLVILDFGISASQFSQSAALRMARAAERSDAAVLVLAPRRMCGTFAALSLTLRRERACFNRLKPNGPALFDGFWLEACVTRNKLGRSGQTVKWKTAIEPSDVPPYNRTYQAERSDAELTRLRGAQHTNQSATSILNKDSLATPKNETSLLLDRRRRSSTSRPESRLTEMTPRYAGQP